MAVFLGLILPWLPLFGSMEKTVDEPPYETTEIVIQETQTATVPVQTEPETKKTLLPVLLDDNTVAKLELDTYVLRVLLSEIPAEFENEALKAQAVVARTYALRRLENGYKHENAAVCTNSACCQGYCTEQAYIDAGNSKKELKKMKNAVKATASKVITYNGELVEATYFSCSGGRTEDAQAVWGSEIPYLQSVESTGEEKATYFTDTITMKTDVFAKKIDVTTIGPSQDWIGQISYTDGGGVDMISICGRSYTGTEIRNLLGLRSTAFAITIIGDTVTITTKGFGHRVGMSQYGADAMAVQGSSYQEILKHYYKGITLSEYAS